MQTEHTANSNSTATAAPGRPADQSSAMPPPPAPAGKRAMLEREAAMLSSCFKNAVVKTGQIYAFHADTRRLGIHKYAAHPPRTQTASLGHELEKFDQICDAIELQLLRAISVLKRDLTREERRAREAEQAAIAAQASRIPVPTVETAVALPSSTPSQGSPQGPPQHISMRRPSAISLSSLNRSALPPKLDLSSSSMRISAEEVALFPQGLVPSPVSLAPKSARPSATADIDLMAAFASATAANPSSQRVDIDLTDSPPAMMTRVDPALGSSVDKPIELDLDNIDMGMSDMTDLFGDAPGPTSGDGQTVADSLFSPATADSGKPLSADEVPQAQEGDTMDARIDMEILGALHAEHSGQGGNLFDPEISRSSGGKQRLHSGSDVTPPQSLSSAFPQAGMQSGVGGFDLDLSHLDPASWPNVSLSLTDMEAFLNMPSTASNQEGQKPGG